MELPLLDYHQCAVSIKTVNFTLVIYNIVTYVVTGHWFWELITTGTIIVTLSLIYTLYNSL
jgi:hypothetical protein